MEILEWEGLIERSRPDFGPVALTIGVFDGVHVGHQSLLRRVLSRRDERPWVVTFRTNPSRVLFPDTYAGDLMTLGQKTGKLAAFGVEGAVIIDFSRDFGKLKGAEFFSMIWKSFPLRYIALGEDFHCGYKMDTNAEKVRELLEPLDVQVEIIPPVFYRNAVVSSTRMRRSVLNGDFRSVEEMLGHPYVVDASGATARTGKDRTRIDKRSISQVLPMSGSYPVVFKGPEGEKEGTLQIDEHDISWNHRGQVEAILFSQERM